MDNLASSLSPAIRILAEEIIRLEKEYWAFAKTSELTIHVLAKLQFGYKYVGWPFRKWIFMVTFTVPLRTNPNVSLQF